MKPFTDLMIDLETLGTDSDAVILQIGWVFFDRDNSSRTMFSRGWHPSIQEQVNMGFRIDISTMEWWMQDNLEGYQAQRSAIRLPVGECVAEMLEIWDGASNSETMVWAKGTHFDLPILRKIIPEPWSFRNIQDLRTLKLVGEMRRASIEVINEQPHDAVSDAEAQAREVTSLCSIIRLDV